ncbi:ABC transporter permease [Meiothermus granaticius]|uniref:Inner membrane ABC transporter permease protein YdcU n=1 Tax=Meiothermus granaticius NBRC 107808 TaxID=1227551 RepID=A0A399F5G2_9DEIN|nr:ABC transporter permease [Meiothermus granaticius]MCL6526080.1 ABC transporter permease [Thermaceae bacterium]RIH92007.1 Inner membrane ABC transporter permease protein YdcU [Meiothermus granaticius NBRC 107808]GEM86868.1 ABC transporter permease [Meiothermus granaticius NBRC 107808]
MTQTLRPPRGLWRRVSDLFYLHPGLLLFLLLVPPMLWMGIIYLGSLFNLLLYSFYSINGFTGQLEYRFTLDTFKTLLTTPANTDIVIRTVLMALAVTLACGLIAFPIAFYMAFYTRGNTRTLWYMLVLLPLWSSYLVRVYAGRLILAQEGVVSWFFAQLHLSWLLDAILKTPVLGGPSLASSYFGMFVVFTYIWLPYMILPLLASLERVPKSLIQASADLGARPGQTFRRVIWPLAVPGVAAGSIFTFSLTLGDYIIPQVVGQPGFFIGQMVYIQQGTAGNIPLAAAFSVVPIVVITLYLLLVRRLGAFDAL